MVIIIVSLAKTLPKKSSGLRLRRLLQDVKTVVTIDGHIIISVKCTAYLTL